MPMNLHHLIPYQRTFRSTRRPLPNGGPMNAFTLVELLVVSVIGGVLLAATAGVIVSHIRSTAIQEVSQRLRDDFGRISYLMETEIGEGDSVTFAVGCSATSGFTIRLPRLPSLQDGTTPAAVTIRYYNDGAGNLRRIGPDVLPSGELNYATSQDLVVNENTLLTIPACNDPRVVNYSLTIGTPAGSFTGVSQSHVKAGEIN